MVHPLRSARRFRPTGRKALAPGGSWRREYLCSAAEQPSTIRDPGEQGDPVVRENHSSISAQADWFALRYAELARNVESFFRGKPDVVRMAIVCVLAEGHLLIDDVPGVGKTSLAKAISQSIDGAMQRIQF